jgi:ketosteroid isomerase-like protein
VLTPVEVVERLYDAWNEDGLGSVADSIDPEIELIPDPLRPDETSLHGIDGWRRWVQRWDETYANMHIRPDALVPLDDEHVLALVSFSARPRGGQQELSWAAAHVWTVRDGRIAGWKTHLDFSAAKSALGK